MVLRLAMILGLGVCSFFIARALLQARAPGAPGQAALDPGAPLESRTVRRPRPARPDPGSSFRKPSEDLTAMASTPSLAIPPLSDYDRLALESTTAEQARALIRTRIVRSLSDGRACRGSDDWGDSRVLVVLRAVPSDQGVVVESLEDFSVLSGAGLSPEAIRCLRGQVPIPFSVAVPQAASLPPGSVHVLAVLPGRKDRRPDAR
jgi:hypothetical protein